MACDVTKFVTNGARFTTPFLNHKQQKVLRVYAMAKAVANNGGTSYFASATEWRALWAAVNTAFKGATAEQTKAAELSMLASFGNILAGGATSTPTVADVSAALAASVYAQEESDVLLDQAEIFLRCTILALL